MLTMLTNPFAELPIAQALDQIRETLALRNKVVLQAPPGTGKSTAVPLSLLQEPWLQNRKILVLTPRRMAARAAVSRMAKLLGEPMGQTVGYRIRGEACISKSTRIEVITEGILTGMLHSDPSLAGVGLIIIDEFHTRTLDLDLALALTLRCMNKFGEESFPKVLVMSAKQDGELIAEFLGGAPLICVEGKQFPVEVSYRHDDKHRDSIVRSTVKAVEHALAEQSGGILVFLPGKSEISQVAAQLALVVSHQGSQLMIVQLYGGVPLSQVQRAIALAPRGMRKIVLATDVAQSSLTIEGIHTVVDTGLVRVPSFDPVSGMTRLDTRRLSRFSALQRMGQAGRLGPGHCYRLWSEDQQRQLVARVTPEIQEVDLAPLGLQLAAWGIDHPKELDWLDPPPPAAYNKAVAQLVSSGAIYLSPAGTRRLTPNGVRAFHMPMHPRLAQMLLIGCDIHAIETACLLAALLSERNPLASRGANLAVAMQVLSGERPCDPSVLPWMQRTLRQAKRYRKICADIHRPKKHPVVIAQHDKLGVLVASAYPDRIARLRPSQNQTLYQLSNGRSALLSVEDSLAGQEWLASAEVVSHVRESTDRIYSAATLNPAMLQKTLSPETSSQATL